eukprot:SAG22_NODE_807_length_7081_cov_2.460756_11_plen_328_part_00
MPPPQPSAGAAARPPPPQHPQRPQPPPFADPTADLLEPDLEKKTAALRAIAGRVSYNAEPSRYFFAVVKGCCVPGVGYPPALRALAYQVLCSCHAVAPGGWEAAAPSLAHELLTGAGRADAEPARVAALRAVNAIPAAALLATAGTGGGGSGRDGMMSSRDDEAGGGSSGGGGGTGRTGGGAEGSAAAGEQTDTVLAALGPGLQRCLEESGELGGRLRRAAAETISLLLLEQLPLAAAAAPAHAPLAARLWGAVLAKLVDPNPYVALACFDAVRNLFLRTQAKAGGESTTVQMCCCFCVSVWRDVLLLAAHLFGWSRDFERDRERGR